MNEKLINILLDLGIGNDEFISYIESRMKIFSLSFEEGNFMWGCFPIFDDDILKDMRVVVPKIINTKTLLVNIHELTHAYELYYHLGENYKLDVECSEKLAKSKEKEYLKKLKYDTM